MPAPPPLSLPVSGTPQSRSVNRPSGGQDSHLTSPSPAKTSTIHFGAADGKTSSATPASQRNNSYSTTPQQNQQQQQQSSSVPRQQSSSNLRDNSLAAQSNQNTASYQNSQSPSRVVGSNSNNNINNNHFSTTSSSNQQQRHNNNNHNNNSVMRPPPRDERAINAYFKKKMEKENDPNASTKNELRERLHKFFHHYSPHLFHEVDGLVDRFWDHPENLWRKLHKKYGEFPKEEPKGMDKKSRLVRFFKKYEPTLVDEIDKIIVSYGGFDEIMWKALTEKYGPEISPEDADGPGGKYKLPMDLLSRLKRYFKEHDMVKLAKASEMAKTYEKKEADLRTMLKMIYGAELEVDPEAAEREAREEKEREAAAKKENEQQEKETKKWLVAFLQQHNPKRMGEVDGLLAHFKGRQEALKDTVVTLFGTGSIDYNTPRLRLIRIYQRYNPTKLEEVDTLLDRFKDRTAELFDMLRDKYGYENEPEYKPDEYASRWIAQQEHKMPAKMTEKTKKRLQLFFLTYDPKLASSVEHVMVLYRGKEEEMWKTLTERYGPEPEFVDIEEEKRRKEEAEKAERERLETERIEREREAARFRVRVSRMYRRYNPKKVNEVDTVIQKYAGRQKELMEMLVNKYGEEEYFTVEELDNEIDGPITNPVMRERIIRMYHKYNPAKLGELDEVILPKYIGKEEELIAGLCAKYGPEPAWGEGNSIRDRVTRFYIKYKPTKLDQIEMVMEKFVGKEDELIQSLIDKYGEEPEFTDTSSQGSTSQQQQYNPHANSAAADSGNNKDNNNNTPTTNNDRSINNTTTTNNNDNNNQHQQQHHQQLDHYTRLQRFYLKYAPEKANSEQIEKILTKYEGNEDQLWEMLEAKFGPEPSREEQLGAGDININASAGGNNNDSNHQNTSSTLSCRDQVIRYYKKHEPAKLANVDKVLAKFEGKEDELLEMMEIKYGPVPTDAEMAALVEDDGAKSNQQQQQQTGKPITASSTPAEKLTAIYQKYDPSKIENVEMILEKYQGRESILYEMLTDKYALNPTEFGIVLDQQQQEAPQASSPPPASHQQQKPKTFREKLEGVYRKHDPSKIGNIDQILEKYAGQEEVLFEALTTKYGNLSEFGITLDGGASSSSHNQTPQNQNIAASPTHTEASSVMQQPQPMGSSVRDRVMRFYMMYEPAKANDAQVDLVTNKFAGREEELLGQLEAKYGPEPEVPSSPSQKPKVRFAQD